MLVETLLRILRAYLEEVDPATSLYTDEQLLARTADALGVLQSKKVAMVAGLTLDEAAKTFTPEPSYAAGLVIALQTATTVLQSELRGRLKRGEFGISWKSGLEEESSITAAKSYSEMITGLEMELQSVLAVQGQLAVRSQ